MSSIDRIKRKRKELEIERSDVSNINKSIGKINILRDEISTTGGIDYGDIAPIRTNSNTNNVSNNVSIDLNALQEKRKSLQSQLVNYERKKNDDYWWDKDKNIISNIGNVAKKLFVDSDRKNKYAKDDKYDSLLKEYNDTIKAIETASLDNKTYKGFSGSVDKVSDTILGNAVTSRKGIESTVKKILGQTPTDKETALTYEEMLAQKARQETTGAGGVGLDILGSVTRMLPQMMAGNSTGALAMGFANYGGSAYNQARQEGATEKQATAYGVISGSLEMMLNKILPSYNIGGKNVYGKTLTDNIMNQVVTNSAFKNFVFRTVNDAAGEFTEEYLQEFLESIIKNTVLQQDNGADFWNTMKDDVDKGLKQLGSQLFNKENLYAGSLGALTSGIMGFQSNTDAYRYEKRTGRNAETGLTANEQSVMSDEVNKRTVEAQKKAAVDSEVNKIIKEQEKTFGTLTDAEKAGIKNQVQEKLDNGEIDFTTFKLKNSEIKTIENRVKEDLQKGYIDIDTIENTLTQEKTDQIKELEQRLRNIANEQEKTQIEEKLNQLRIDRANDLKNKLRQDIYLQESYAELARKSEKFTYEAKKTDSEIKKNLAEDFKKIANNTNKSHETFETISKIAEDRGVSYGVINNEQLKQLGYDIEGKNVNGLVRTMQDGKRKVLVNLDSDKAINTIVGHETTHLLEGTKEYTNFQEYIKNYAKTKGEYDTRYRELSNLYRGVNANIETEVTADLIGDYLFTDTDFVRNLSVESPTIFKQVYDYIKHVYNLATAGSKEKRQLEQVKYKFEEAYRQSGSYQGNIKYSIQKDTHGNKYVKIDTDQDIFEGKSLSEQTKIAKQYILQKYREDGIRVNAENIKVTSKTANEYTHPKNQLPTAIKSSKMKASTELDNLLLISNYKYSMPDDGRHPFAKDGWDYYETTFDVGNNLFKGLVNIAKNGNKKTLYDITKIKRIGQNRSTSANAFSTSLANSSNNNISQFNKSVKSNTSSTKYSMQKNTNDTQELDNSSFSLEQRVSGDALLDAQDFIDEVKSVGAEVDDNGYVTVYHQTSDENADKIRQSGEMIANEDYVYFSTSKDASQSEGRGQTKLEFKIPAEKLMLDDIFSDNADVKIPLKGKKTLDVSNYLVNDTKYSISDTDNKGRNLSNEQMEYFKDSKAVDENGNLKVLYHGTGTTIDEFKTEFTGRGNDQYGSGFYFTDNQSEAEGYKTSITEKLGGTDNPNVIASYLNIKKPIIADGSNLSNSNIEMTHKQTVEIIKKAPNLYDVDESPIGNWHDVWNDGVKDYMIDDVATHYEGDLMSLENDFFHENATEFRQAVCDATGYDGVIHTYGNGNTHYVAWFPNQIKSIDNANPTLENANIFRSLSNQNEIAPRNSNLTYGEDIKLKMLPTKEDISNLTKQVNNLSKQLEMSRKVKNEDITNKIAPIKNNKVLNPVEIANLRLEDANTTPQLTNKKYEKGDKTSKLYKNVTEKSQMLPETARTLLSNEENVKYYKNITNEESMDNALKKLQQNGSNETIRWVTQDSKSATATDVAEGWILLKQYSDNKDYDSMIEIAKKMRDIGTKAGQTVQAFNIMSRLTPEGMVKYAQSELTDAYNQMVKNKSQDWINKNMKDFDLTPSDVEFIMNTMKKVQNMEDGYEKRVELAKIQKLMTDKIPSNAENKIKAWMRVSMLFNPKTQVRNVVGNALIIPVNYFSDVVSNYADKVIQKQTGVRTTGTYDIKAMLKGMKDGAYQATNDYKLGINTKNMDGNRFEIGEGNSFNEKNAIGRTLNRTESMLNYVMDAGDRIFSQAIFENSISNQLKLNNATEITQEMIDIATTESLQRTWNDNNNYTKFVLDVRKMLNRLNFKGYGLGDILIPFAKTPANLTKAIVDYSPVGLISAINQGIKLKNNISTDTMTAQQQHQFVQTLGKATAGSMLYVIAYALAKAGIATGASDDDKDTANFLKNTLGISSYSIKIGDKSFTYDWAQPIAAPLSIMTNIANKSDKTKLYEAIVGNLDTATSVLMEQSFLQSINEVLNGNGGAVENLLQQVYELPSRAVPTFVKQIADMVDETQRQTYEKDAPIKTAINKTISKIPFISQTLAPSVDTLGRNIQKYGGKNNIFNVFLNPANVNTENISKSAEEIYRLYKITGDKTIMPRVAPSYINSKGEKVILSSQEKSDFQRIAGNIVEESIENLLDNKTYETMSDEDKASIINKIVNYSYNKARKKVLGIEMSNEYNKINEYVNDGGFVSEYYINKEEIDFAYNNPEKYQVVKVITGDIVTCKKYSKDLEEIKSDKDSNGKTIANSRKQKVFDYINSTDLNFEQRVMLAKLEYPSYDEYNNEIIEYLNNNKDISYEEEVEILKQLGFEVDSYGNISW